MMYLKISVLTIIGIVLTFLIPDATMNFIGYSLILTVGVCHGANDLKIYYKDNDLTFSKTIKFILRYSIVVLLGFALFFLIPDVVLTLFLILSGFHFGQEHFESYNLKSSLTSSLFYLFYGLLIIMTLIHIHHADSLEVINELTTWIKITSNETLWIVICLITGTVITGLLCLRTLTIKDVCTELFFLSLIIILFYYGNLVWGFAMYFVLWHSAPSIRTQIRHLYGHVTTKHVILYLKDSLLYWIGSIIFLTALYYFLQDKNQLFLTIIVAFLGGITFPHVFVMNTINGK